MSPRPFLMVTGDFHCFFFPDRKNVILVKLKKKKLEPIGRSSGAATLPKSLKGWQEIAHFLGQPVSVAQRWAKTGMPVSRSGRYVTAVPEELNSWLGRETGGDPVHVATEEGDLSAELKRGLAFLRRKE